MFNYVLRLPYISVSPSEKQTSKIKSLSLPSRYFKGSILYFLFHFWVHLKSSLTKDVKAKHWSNFEKMMDVYGGIKKNNFLCTILKGVRENFGKKRPQANGR